MEGGKTNLVTLKIPSDERALIQREWDKIQLTHIDDVQHEENVYEKEKIMENMVCL